MARSTVCSAGRHRPISRLRRPPAGSHHIAPLLAFGVRPPDAVVTIARAIRLAGAADRSARAGTRAAGAPTAAAAAAAAAARRTEDRTSEEQRADHKETDTHKHPFRSASVMPAHFGHI